MDGSVQIRALAARDSLDGLTELLHRAYAPLAAQGLNFTAATQTAEVTCKRAAEGQCLVAEVAGELVGTVTVSGPFDLDSAPWTQEVPWFRNRDTAHMHQLAVDPIFQGRGVGRRLVAASERWAREQGYAYMALDTAARAGELRALYRHMGYADVGQVQWEGKTYTSVIMQKLLHRSPLREHLQTQARYHLWATRALAVHVDMLPEADYRRDLGLFFKSIHGTLNHLLLAETELWLPRFAQGVSPSSLALDQELEPDRAQLARRLVAAAQAWLAPLDGWSDEHLLGTLDYQRMDGQAVSLPFAATLAHVFNHGTHHRGQISAALTALGRPCPELDMVKMLQQESRAS
jgi:uncharacterized damage-inducible protein DinB/GNAT superfamily N-acetyltransferase